jgi:MFS family permease
LSSDQWEWLLTAFYITYIAFEWMTLMYRVAPPHVYISLCVCAWGLVASFQSVTTSFVALVTLRALLGVAEAAFGPGVPFYLSLFYKREELAFRTGLFVSAASLATSFAGSLAWVIVKLSKNGPVSPWRTLFLVEGFPSVVVAVFAWMFIPDSPETARFLTTRQRKVAKLRLEGSKAQRHEAGTDKFNWRAVGETLSDPKSYLTAVCLSYCLHTFYIYVSLTTLCSSCSLAVTWLSVRCLSFCQPSFESKQSVLCLHGIKLTFFALLTVWAIPP